MNTPEKEMLNQISEWLNKGASIKATNPSLPVLQKNKGGWNCNLTIEFPK